MLVGALRTLAEHPHAARERRVLLEAALARGLPPDARRVRPLRRRRRPVHRLRPRRGRRALRDVRSLRRPSASSPRPSRWCGASSAASCGAALAEPPGPTTTAEVERLARRQPRAPPRAPAAQRRAALTAATPSRAARGRPDYRSPSGMAKNDLMDRVVNLAKRRGLVFPSSEIYGGFRSTWDYGPLGVLLKRNVKDAWWRSHGAAARRRRRPRRRHPHGAQGLGGERARRHLHRPARRLPQLQGALPRRPAARVRARARTAARRTPSPRPASSTSCSRPTSARWRTTRRWRTCGPETAQGIFVNFANVQTTTRKKPPFGIAQIGKSFRNEITPGNFIFRTREFEQMEMEFFVPPEDGAAVVRVLVPGAVPLVHRPRHPRGRSCGCARTTTEELSHYSAGTSDVEFQYPWGWGELEGIANRTDFDLTQHSKFSGQDLTYFDQEHDRRYVPVRDRAGGRRRPRHARLPARRLRGGGRRQRQGRHREAHGAAPRTPASRRSRSRCCPLSKNEQLVPVADEVAATLRPAAA